MGAKTRAVRRALRRISPCWTLRGSPIHRGRASFIQVDAAGEAERLVVLTHGERDRAFNADIARDEYRLLELLHAEGMPVARPLALVEDYEPPFLITSLLRGAPRFASKDVGSFCRQLAAMLSAIHAVDVSERDVSFLPRLADVVAAEMERRRGDERIWAALRGALPVSGGNASVLLHGDFWPGNLLWEGDRLTGIIDWEDAMLGDPLADLGKSRLEVMWALGAEAMEIYTAQYLALNPGLDASALPVWGLFGAARLAHFASFARDAEAARRMEAQYADFVAAGLSAL